MVDDEMEINEILKGIKCDCGQFHECPIEKVCICDGAINELNNLIEDGQSVLLVADENTFNASGEKVVDVLGDKLKNRVIFSGAKVLVPDEVAIAGMGGEEIVKILSSAMSLPKKLVLAPQKNSDKVRKLLFHLGYKILKDFTIKDKGKFYDIISAVEADIEPKEYTNLEYIYGRDNLNERPDDFIEKLTLDEILYEGVVQTKTASETAKSVAMQKLKEIREILK